MGPEALAQVLRPLAGRFDAARFPALLRGLEAPDDALVWKLDESLAVVQTADFFPPVVDDPYFFGAIAAANALSDLYAMGADPIFGINLVGFPDDLDSAILTEILRGGADKMAEAGAAVAGGHTTVDREPKYGLAVTGLVHPARILTKAGARPGDVLLLTKPIGTGLITTAHKRDRVDPGDLDLAVASMARLSAKASKLLRESGAVHALTDVTGFGLAGHAHEMAEQSGVALRIEWDAVARLQGAEHYAAEGMVAGGLRRNEAYYSAWTRHDRALGEVDVRLLHDPQTSGGLLAAVDGGAVAALLDRFHSEEEPVWRIGEAVAGEAGWVHLV